MDFVQDALFNGERFRVLTVAVRRAVDNCTGPPGGKICHGLLAGKSLRGTDVVAELSRICLVEGCFPQRIQCDNGSERTAAAVYFKRNGLMGGGPCRHIQIE
jgi:putative transposase